MTVTAAQLLVRVSADTAQAQQAVGGLSGMLGKTGILGVAGIGAVAVIAGIGVASVKMAGDFQASMITLVTGAGESRKNLNLVSDGILQMSRDTGTSTQQLAAGMFMIESAGFHGQQGLDVLRAAAEGAKVGVADLGVVGDAVTTVMKDYEKQNVSAAQATNILIATVAQGKTHMQDLAESISHVLPAAEAAGVGLNDVMAAMATMTGLGVPAADAATYLRQTIIALSAPSKQSQKMLEEIGLTSAQVADTMHKSLPNALKEITDALVAHGFKEGSAQYIAAIKEISGGSKQMQGMLDLTGAHMKDFNQDLGKIASAARQGGSQITGWTLVQTEFNFRVSQAVETVKSFMIQLGEKLLPVIMQLADAFTRNAVPALTAVAPIFLKLAQIVVTNVIPAIQTIASSVAKNLLPPLEKLWNALSPLLIPAFQAMGWLLKNVTAPVLGVLIQILGGLITLLANILAPLIKNVILPLFTLLANIIKTVVQFVGDLIGKVATLASGPLKGLGGMLSGLASGAGGLLAKLPHLAGGTDNFGGGLAVVGEHGPELVGLPRGASVMPYSAGRSGAGGGAGTGTSQTIIVQLDGHVITRAVVRNLPREVRLATGARSI